MQKNIMQRLKRAAVSVITAASMIIQPWLSFPASAAGITLTGTPNGDGSLTFNGEVSPGDNVTFAYDGTNLTLSSNPHEPQLFLDYINWNGVETLSACQIDGFLWTVPPVGGAEKLYLIAKTNNNHDAWNRSHGELHEMRSITYNENYTEAGTTKEYYRKDGTYTYKAAPTREGYSFYGWNTQSDGNGTNYAAGDTINTDIMNSGSVTLFAQWILDNYSITYYLDGGEVAEANPTEYNIESAAITLTNPTKTGFTFGGWSGTGLTGNTTTVTIPTGSTGDRTYIAHWLENHTVTFDSKGGTAVAGITAAHDATITEPTAPTKTGYTFDGWYKEEGLTSQWDFGTDTVTANITLYAKWTPVNYNINYSLDGGTVAGTNPTEYNIESAAITLTNPTKNGFTFGGWSGTGLTGNTTTVTIPTGSTGNRTYIAHWLENHTVTFESNGGSAVAGITAAHDATITEPTAPTKTGYTFDGWYKEEALTTQWDFGTDTVTANITLYAKWILDNYNINYNLDGGEVAEANPTEYNIESAAITLTNPTKTGFTFGGWSGTDLTGNTTTVTIPTGSTGDRRYTAHWLENHTVTFESNGGSAVAGITAAHDATITEPTAPTKTGYTFDGWYKEEALTNQWNFGTDTVTANITLYAKWTAIPPLPTAVYTLTFDPNGGTVSFTTLVQAAGTAVTPPTATREGYIFICWAPEVPTVMPDYDRTFTAQWTRIPTPGDRTPESGDDDDSGRGGRNPETGDDDDSGRGGRNPETGDDDDSGRGGRNPETGDDDDSGRGGRNPETGDDDDSGRGGRNPETDDDDDSGRGGRNPETDDDDDSGRGGRNPESGDDDTTRTPDSGTSGNGTPGDGSPGTGVTSCAALAVGALAAVLLFKKQRNHK